MACRSSVKRKSKKTSELEHRQGKNNLDEQNNFQEDAGGSVIFGVIQIQL